MNKFFAYCCSFILVLTVCVESNENRVVIPQPQEGFISLTKCLAIDSVVLFSESGTNAVRQIVDSAMTDLGEEGYELTIDKSGVKIVAGGQAGLYYAKITLRQLYKDGHLPYAHIKDKPRFSHRGVMLDVSRHFFTKDEVMRLLDRMAYYKLNKFHWHLTDDGGWRIEMDSYPELTAKTAYRTHWDWKDWWRNGGKFVSQESESRFGGFYSKEDIREIIKYASDRFITIIPEIEFPGHSREVFVAYPELCCAKKPYHANTYCVGNDSTYVFMERVLNEVMDIFPSEFIHIGGDETNKGPWKECTLCQSLMEREAMHSVYDLHNYIIGKAEKIIMQRGRRMIGWDEIVDNQLNSSSAVMSWRGEEAGITAAQRGYDVVLTPLSHLYLDYFQGHPSKEPFAHDGYTTLEKVYSYNPIPDTLSTIAKQHILGVQGSLWSEWIQNEAHLEYMAFPRLLAVAEVAWSNPDVRSWKKFRTRLSAHVDALSMQGVNVRPLSSDIEADMTIKNKQMTMALKCERADVEICYTLDGSEPSSQSMVYTAPILVADSIALRAKAFKDNNPMGDEYAQHVYNHKAIGAQITSFPLQHNQSVLLDGRIGSNTYLDGTWLNFSGDQEFIVDLGSVNEFNKVVLRWMKLQAGARRALPNVVEVMFSHDNLSYVSAGVIFPQERDDTSVLQLYDIDFSGDWKARYVKLKIQSQKGGMSMDEIVII